MSTLSRLRDLISRDGAIDYDKAKKMARDKDPAVRKKLAGYKDMTPEILYFLAEDENSSVRRQTALNEATPAQANLLLADDKDVAVRADLAGKIARLAPGLTPNQRDRVKRITYQALMRLARDQMPKVRRIVAETLQDVADAPYEVILHLAQDSEAVVAKPVLRFSPVLTDDDLMQVINSHPPEGALTAIAQRTRVTERISDAIIHADDTDAITGLLKNKSAQIREETLDRLVDKAPGVVQWHAPLTRRPVLSAQITLKLAKFVAHNLVKALLERHDIDPATAAEIAVIVDRRIEEEGAEPLDSTAPEKVDKLGPEWEQALEAAYEEAQARHDADRLDEAYVVKVLNAGEPRPVLAALAVLADLPVKMTAHIIESRSAKGILGLVWKTGLSAELAAQVQTKMGKVPPDEAIKPTDAGAYPMTDAELEWQLELFTG